MTPIPRQARVIILAMIAVVVAFFVVIAVIAVVDHRAAERERAERQRAETVQRMDDLDNCIEAWIWHAAEPMSDLSWLDGAWGYWDTVSVRGEVRFVSPHERHAYVRSEYGWMANSICRRLVWGDGDDG